MNAVKSEHRWLTLQEAAELTGKNTAALRMWVKRRLARGEQVQVKKKKAKHGDVMMIHSQELEHVRTQGREENLFESLKNDKLRVSSVLLDDEAVKGELLYDEAEKNRVPFTCHEQVRDLALEFMEYHDRKREEWECERDKLVQGMMMYRYKFEDLDRQLRLLPAPPERVTSKVQELEAESKQKARALEQAEEIITEAKNAQKKYSEAMTQLRARLREEERARQDYRTQLIRTIEEAKRPWWKKMLGLWKDHGHRF
jgi:hypothetical protein